MIRLIKKLGLAYIAFGLGVVAGSVIASVVAAFIMMASLDAEQLERVRVIADDLKEK